MDPKVPLNVTWYYMVKDIDQGPVILEAEILLPSGTSRETLTSVELDQVAFETCF